MIQLLALAVLPACTTASPPSKWTRDAAYSGIYTTLDQNRDGQVDAEEYDNKAYAAPAFNHADTDQDGTLSQEEIAALITHQDPLIFDLRPEPKAVNLQLWRSSFAGDPQARLRREIDELLAEP